MRFIKITLCVFLFFIIAFEVFTAVTQNEITESGENYALIIGINDYENWEDLKTPQKDAEELAKVLIEKYNFKKKNVALLTNQTEKKPTWENIALLLRSSLKKLKETDNLLIYFSGHSAQSEITLENYWIPVDGHEILENKWLAHSYISKIINSDRFKAKNVLLLVDSNFTQKLLKKKYLPLTKNDLRYEEKILERSYKRSREVIAFGEDEPYVSNSTKGHGLFTYYILMALRENKYRVLDFESLFFDDEIFIPVSKISGTKIVHGRFKTAMDEAGQFILKRIADLPAINVADLAVSPDKGYIGDSFYFKVKTSASAYEVYVEIDGERFYMEGVGTDWNLSKQIDKLGTSPYMIVARNEDGIEGQTITGEILIQEKRAKAVSVAQAEVSPRRGSSGDEFKFSATTDISAKKVYVIIAGKRYEMAGKDREWTFSRKIEDIGTIEYAMVAINEEDLESSLRPGTFIVRKKVVPVAVEVRFIDNGDGTITDTSTDMMWLQDASVKATTLTWEKATEFLKDFEHEGYGDWRLPTSDEWKELIDDTQENPALPLDHPFEDVVTFKEYWSKTKHPFGPSYVWQANLWYGKLSYKNKKERALVWPIRYSKAPK